MYGFSGSWFSPTTRGQGLIFDFSPSLHTVFAAWYTFARNGAQITGGASQSPLAEARRVLRPLGQLVIFDGDFATLTVALFDGDPLQATVPAVLRHWVHAPYIMRRLSALVTAARFSLQSVEPHGYVQTTSPDYLLTLLSRGIQAAGRAGEIDRELVDGFDREARRRVANGTFYGAMLFVSLTGRAVLTLGGRHTIFGVVDGLQAGQTYTFDVAASNAAGEGAVGSTQAAAASPQSAAVSPQGQK